MMTVRAFGLCLLAACSLLTACKPSPPATPSAALMANDPHVLLQAEMEKASMDFSQMVVVRLMSNGKRLEATSALPLVVAETQVNGHLSKTIFRINDKRDGITLFSRDLPNGKSFRTELSLAELEQKKSFSFPVVQPDASLKEHSFELEKIIVR